MKKAGVAVVVFLIVLVVWQGGWLNDERVVGALESFFRVLLGLFDRAGEKIARLFGR